MPTILLRIFLLYNILNSFISSLLPKKLIKLVLPSSWYSNNPKITHQEPEQEQVQETQKLHKRMDSKEIKRVFEMFDKNGDGRITKKELNDSLENLGIFIPDKELNQMIENIDINGDGCVDLEEFGSLYQSIMDEKDEDEDMKEAFNVFDQNGDGFISGDELKSVLASFGLKQGKTIEDCKQMIMKVDSDGDGLVNFHEFKQMMKGGAFITLT